MNKFKLEFELAQHTPLIHFRADDNNATLRASELKPKFDKFLDGKVDSSFFVKNQKGKHLNYKVKVFAKDSEITEIDSRNPLFFGNMGDDEDKKEFLTSKEIKIEFFSFNRVLLNEIKKHFEAFLANTNFATRQSKGFGSFYIEGKEFNKELIEAKNIYYFVTSSFNLSSDISLLYKLLRAGINQKGRGGVTTFYAKSLLFLYFKTKNITWDKRAIKDKYQTNNFNPKSNYKLVKDLLGLSSTESWRDQKMTITKENSDIDRFPSPITFKPIKENNGQYRVYFWAENSDEMLNQEFHIKRNRNGNLRLRTPNKFDIDEFLKFAINTNISHIENKYREIREFKDLERIFNSIK